MELTLKFTSMLEPINRARAHLYVCECGCGCGHGCVCVCVRVCVLSERMDQLHLSLRERPPRAGQAAALQGGKRQPDIQGIREYP